MANSARKKSRSTATRSQTPVAPKSGAAAAAAHRNPRFDALRGLAIALMVLDHVAMILWKLQLESDIRSMTRLAEPLFVVLFGYLLYGRTRARLGTRGLQLLAAALVSNALFYPAYHTLSLIHI